MATTATSHAATGTDVLFTPVRLGPLTVRNRIVMAPMGTCLDESGHITDETIAYYVRRARGGLGTITVEGCLVSDSIVGPEPKICGPQYLPGLTRLVEALRPYDITIGVQFMHSGRQVVEGPVVAPSPVPLNSMAPVPHELTHPEIDAIVADYAQAARYAAEAGFDFVEVHGAHGYLPSNFLSPRDNQRTDGYGGSLAGRARFSREVARAIVGAVDLPLVWRLNGDDHLPGGMGLEDCVQVARWLEADGAASLSISGGTWHTLQVTLAPMSTPRGHLVPYAAAVKAAVGVPVMAVGRLDDPDVAAAVIARGEADLICIGRGLIAEPDWAQKVRDDRRGELRPCISCNACVELVGRGEVARCAVNPEAGRELTWAVPPAVKPQRIMVVGSGPAGMEAARIARLRGHEVSLWERDGKLGGKLEAAGLAPSKHEVLRFRDFQARRLVELGVEPHLGVEVTPEIVAAAAPDAVLLATGADPLVPPIPGLDGDDVHDALDLLDGRVPVARGARVAVVGGSATGCETAEHLIDAGAQVAIVEMRGSIGFGIESITRREIVRRLKRDGVEILTTATVVAVEPGAVIWRDPAGTEHRLAVDHVALAIGWRPRGALLADALRAAGHPVTVFGDAEHAADFVHAINAGADAALAL